MSEKVRSGARYFSFAVAGLAVVSGCGGDPQAEAVATGASALSSSSLLASAVLDQPSDLALVSDPMENGMNQNVLGGIGSGLAWAGGTTFLGVPDRGPNATAYPNGASVDNTTSFIARVQTIDLSLAPASAGPLPFVLTPTLQATTLLYAAQPLVYGNTPGLPSALPSLNVAGKSYFSGRSDNFGPGPSTNPAFARFDPEAIRVSQDGSSVFIADEYGPYIYQFERASGRRIRVYALPDHFAISNLSSVGATEIAANAVGRVTNKGIEGLAITPDGRKLVALVQSPLLQDGGDGARPNRIVTIDVATGDTHEYVYDNQIGTKAYNSSEIVALNDHQFLIDTRDGKGLGDGSAAVVKQLWAVDIAGAEDVASLSGQAALLASAVPKRLFLDVVAVLSANGWSSANIPAKIEGLAIGKDVVVNGTVTHTLYVANDNDFVPAVAGPNRWFVFGFTDADLAAINASFTPQDLVERGPDLAIGIAAPTASAVTGSTLSYTFSVQNNGLVPASGVSVSDLLPAELQFTSCASSGICATAASGPFVTFASLGAGATATGTIAAKLGCAVANGTVITNRAVAASSLADPTPANNTADAVIAAVNPAPTISGVSVNKSVLAPPNGKMSLVRVNYEVADNCPGTTCSLAVTSNQGSATDWVVVDAHTVQLRAKRTNDTTRAYAIAITCVDSGGARAVSGATVSVLHD